MIHYYESYDDNAIRGITHEKQKKKKKIAKEKEYWHKNISDWFYLINK